MKKNSFLGGAFVATSSILLCKIIGLLYVIPFYGIIGSKGGALYSYAYSIYSIFLSLSTCGIPIAVSKLVSEYNALKKYDLKEKTYKVAANMITIIGLIAFILLFVFAEQVAFLFIGNVEGGNTIEEISVAIRIISVALLVVPQQSVLRGYLQGHKMLTTTSISNLLEQTVRVFIIIAGSYITVKVLGLSINFAVYVAIFAATLSALSSYLYLKYKIHKNRNLFETTSHTNQNVDKKQIVKKIVFCALPFVIIDLIRSAYGIVDSLTVVKALVNLGYDVTVAETTIGVLATWASKLNMIVASVALGLATSLIPNIASSFAKKDMKDVNNKLNQSYKAILFIALPMAFGLSFLARPVWVAFYGYEQLSIDIFRYYILQAIIFCVYTIALNSAQTLNKTKISLGALFVNFILKFILNVPIMYFLKFIGIEAYYGTIVTNVLVQGGATLFIILALKREFKFKSKTVIKSVAKSIFCLIVMLLVLSLMKIILPLDVTGRLSSILIIIPYALVGSIVYFIMAQKLNIISDIFGEDYIEKMKSKLKNKFKKN